MYNSRQKLAILISKVSNSSSRKSLELLEYFVDYDNFALQLHDNKAYITELFDKDTYNAYTKAVKCNMVDELIFQLKQKSIQCITIGDDNYPTLLSNIADPPITLYCKGDVNLLKTKCFSVVGTRKVNSYGKRVTTNFVMVLSHYFTIVSGLAYGVDAIAHKTTLAERGKTIAVLGGGLDNIYPASHTELAVEIINNGGLLMSEYPPEDQPRNYTFPRRNRIVAGLSKGLLVCQASLKSGTFSTVESALENGRDVFVVPGEVYDYGYMGNNQLIKSMQGAMVTSPTDITKAYNLDSNISVQQSLPLMLTDMEQKVYNLLQHDKYHYNDIVVSCNILPQQANVLLANMQIKGLIDKLPGNYYCIFGGK